MVDTTIGVNMNLSNFFRYTDHKLFQALTNPPLLYLEKPRISNIC